MKPSFDHPLDVLRFCQNNPDATLVIVTSVQGGAMRSAGALMAVSTSEVAGYVSNGCVDADIVMRARQEVAGQFVYGEGSPFRDIVLPCGGQIEVAIVPSPDQDVILTLLSGLDARRPTRFFITPDFKLKTGSDPDAIFQTTLLPKLRLRVAGRGAALVALSKLALASGLDIILQSPEPLPLSFTHLRDPENLPDVQDDNRTAVILLFHDHDWEPGLLKQALQGPAFYVGAMGSVRTQRLRRERLTEMGIDPLAIERVHGPIGLLPAMRNANLLAVSVLAEIIQAAQAEGLL